VDLRRLRPGEIIAGLSGLLLLISLFLPWYTHDVATSFAGSLDLESQNAFQALAVADLILLVIAFAAIGLPIVTAAEKTVAVPLTWASLLNLTSLVAIVLVLVHLGSSPDPAQNVEPEVRRAVETGLAGGIYLALGATVGLFVGTLLAMRDERLSKRGRLTDTTGKPVASAPEPELLSPPPAQ